MPLIYLSDYLEIAIISQCFFSICYLSSYQWRRNKWLVVIFSALLMLQLGIAINTDGLIFWQKIIIGNPAFVMLTLPSIYFYTYSLVEAPRSGFYKSYLHFIPFLFFYILFLFIEIEPPEEFVAVFAKGGNLPFHLSYFITLLGMATWYGMATLKLIRLNQTKYQNEYAETTIYLTLDWLKYLCWFLFAIFIVSIAGMITSNLIVNIHFPFWLLEFFFLLACMSVSFFSFRQPTLYQSAIKKVNNNTNATTELNEVKEMLTEKGVNKLSQHLNTFIKEERPYLNASIKMPEIANQLNVSPNVLSWLLNEHYDLNFFTFINQHRIQYAIDLLKNPDWQHYTLEAISEVAGFKSKTTFNTRFKEITGQTPSQFRRGPKDFGENTHAV